MRLLRSAPPDVEKLTRERDTDGLVRALRYEDPVTDRDGRFVDLGAAVRTSAATALGELDPGTAEVHDALVRALGDPVDGVRVAVVRALGRHGSPAAAEPLLRAVTSWREPEAARARHEAVAVLASLGGPDISQRVAAELLAEPAALHETDGEALRELAEASVPGAVRETVAFLVPHLSPASTPERARALLVALAPESVDPLIATLEDGGARREAAVALGEIRDSRAVDALSPLLAGHADPDTRRAAAWALGEIRDPAAVQALLVATRDSDYGVRAEAIGGFDKLGNAGIAVAVGALVRPGMENGAPPAVAAALSPTPPPAPKRELPARPAPLLRRLLGR